MYCSAIMPEYSLLLLVLDAGQAMLTAALKMPSKEMCVCLDAFGVYGVAVCAHVSLKLLKEGKGPSHSHLPHQALLSSGKGAQTRAASGPASARSNDSLVSTLLANTLQRYGRTQEPFCTWNASIQLGTQRCGYVGCKTCYQRSNFSVQQHPPGSGVHPLCGAQHGLIKLAVLSDDIQEATKYSTWVNVQGAPPGSGVRPLPGAPAW